MSDASSQIRIAYAQAAEIPRIHINRFHLTDDRARLAILRNSCVIHRLRELGKVVVLIPYEDLHMGRTRKINRYIIQRERGRERSLTSNALARRSHERIS